MDEILVSSRTSYSSKSTAHLVHCILRVLRESLHRVGPVEVAEVGRGTGCFGAGERAQVGLHKGGRRQLEISPLFHSSTLPRTCPRRMLPRAVRGSSMRDEDERARDEARWECRESPQKVSRLAFARVSGCLSEL